MIESSERAEVWISRCEPQEVREQARRVDVRVAAGERLPLAGLTAAVKDNIFRAELALGRRAAGVMARQGARPWPPDAPLGASRSVVIAVPRDLPDLDSGQRQAFGRAVARLAQAGHELLEVDASPFLKAGRLLFNGAFLAERYASVGKFIERHPGAVDPVAGEIILTGGAVPPHALVRERQRLAALRREADLALGGAHMLLLPIPPAQPRLEDVVADPLGADSALGLYAARVNLLDRCAVALPMGRAGKAQFGVTLTGAAFADALVCDMVADLCEEEAAREGAGLRPRGLQIFVAGTRRRGRPLNPQLTCHGARFCGAVHTIAEYRMHRLPTRRSRVCVA
jgi:allophanate hydrolase